MRTARAMGYRTVAVYSSADADAEHVRQADEAVWIGEAPPAQSYLRIDAIVLALRAVDQPQLPRMSHRHVMGQRPELLVQMPIAAGGLVADRERLIERSQPIDHRRARAFELNLIDGAAGTVENAHRRLFGMNVQSDVEHASLLFGFEAT